MFAWLFVGEMFRVACFSSQESVQGHNDRTDKVEVCHYNQLQSHLLMLHNKQPTADLPVLFLYSMSYEVMTLFPSNLCVQRRFMLRSLTSRTSNSGGSGGSEEERR